MSMQVGVLAALARYSIKSMRGEAVLEAGVGWHGVEGDRRLALRRAADRGGFPWLTVSRCPALLLHTPVRSADAPDTALPSQVRTPDGTVHDTFDPSLADAIGAPLGFALEMVRLDRGIFDEASVSIISPATVSAVCSAAGLPADARRFRPNLLIDAGGDAPFAEDAWVGGVLTVGDRADAPQLAVTHRDVRCAMVNYDPDTARTDAALLKTIASTRATCAGVYATVLRPGVLRVGAVISWRAG